MSFTRIDILIITLYLFSTIGVGLITRRYISNISDFLVAGRGMNIYLGIAALAASELGLVTVMYHAELGYVGGFSAFSLGIIAGGVMTFIGFTGFVIYKLRSMRIMTVPEFYERKYSRGVRWVGGSVMAVGGILNMGIFIRLAADFINAVSGISDVYLSITSTILVIIILFYTVWGGMVSVILTDYLHYVTAMIGFLIATVFILQKVGYFNILHAVRLHLGSAGLNPFSSSQYGILFIIYQIFLWNAVITTWQTIASKAYSSKDARIGKRIFFWTGLTFLGRATVPMFWGMAALAYFGPNENTMTAMPRMLADILPPGIIGIVVAAMLATFMSCTSSYILGWSSLITQDVIGPIFKDRLTSRQRILLTRIFIVLIGIFLLIWGQWYKIPDTAWNYLALTGTIYLAGSLSCVVAGCYWNKANKIGAYSAIFLGTITPLGFVILTQVKEKLPEWLLWITNANISAMLSYLMAIGGMIIGSLISQKRYPSIDISTMEEGFTDKSNF